MYRNCTTEETAARQRQLESRLLEQMLHKPYDQISVSDLCAEARISRKSFYRYFGSKDGCLNALIDHTITDLVQYPSPSSQSAGDWPPELKNFLSYWHARQQLLSVLLSNDLTVRLINRFIRHVLEEENRTLRQLGYGQREFSDSELIFVVTGLVSMVLNWHMTGYKMSADQLAAQLHRLLTQPLVAV